MYRDTNQRDFARKLRREMTEAEHVLWKSIRRGQLHGVKFRRQAAIGRYIADFVNFDSRLVIEIDGGQHNSAEGRDADKKRTDWLLGQGFRVLRFWNFQVLEDIDSVVEAIWIALDKPTDGASPLP